MTDNPPALPPTGPPTGPPNGPSTAPPLRLATKDDAAAIRALTREAYAKWIPLIGREPKPMTADYDAAVRKHRIDLLYVDDRLAAVIETIPEDDHLLIENIAVSPAFQHRGFGRMLLAHAERVAAGLGHAVIRLYTNTAFAGNVRLYQSAGYAIDRAAPFMGGTTVYMSKPVPAHSPPSCGSSASRQACPETSRQTAGATT